jgi:hypothetical protein
MAIELVHGLNDDLMALQTDVKPFLWLAPRLAWVPRLGGDLAAAPHLMRMGTALSQAGEALITAAAPLLDQSDSEVGFAQQALVVLRSAQPALLEARELLDRAAAARNQISLDDLSTRLQKWIARLDKYLPLAQEAIEAGLLAPRLLGADGMRSYLILAQNDDELRATGGFITAVGLVQVDKADIIDITFTDSYAVDDLDKYYPDPPEPLLKYMLAEQWLFRDSNWSPDFPTAAQQMMDFYQYGTSHSVDGVVAIDMPALKLLVQALGPVTIPGLDEPINADNVVDWMRQARGGINPGEGMSGWWEGRKDFIAQLALALKSRLEKGQFSKTALARAVQQGLVEKHILIYLSDTQAASQLGNLGWDGTVVATDEDYLLVVDSNVGFNKVNPMVEETLQYRVDLSGNPAQSELHIAYVNHSPGNLEDCNPLPRYGSIYQEGMERCYWDYLRVYVPSGSSLLEASPAPQPEVSLRSWEVGGGGDETTTVGPPEFGKQVFGQYLLVPRGEREERYFRYSLPSSVVKQEGSNWVYRLTVQKQPGSRDLAITVIVELPSGAELINSQPSPSEVRGGSIVYQWKLLQDLQLEIHYR